MSALIALLWVAAVLGISFVILNAPEFKHGEIHECVGCRGAEHQDCPGCRYNPKYWDGMTYTGPTRRELKKLRR